MTKRPKLYADYRHKVTDLAIAFLIVAEKEPKYIMDIFGIDLDDVYEIAGNHSREVIDICKEIAAAPPSHKEAEIMLKKVEHIRMRKGCI